MQQQPKKYGIRYPWKMWFEKTRFRLVQGKHYHQKSYIMAQMVRNTAGRGIRGMPPFTVRIKIAEDEKYIDVEVVPKPIKESKRAPTSDQ